VASLPLPLHSSGGIVASALDGKIRLTNTLDARLDLLGQEVRDLFFFFFFFFFSSSLFLNLLLFL